MAKREIFAFRLSAGERQRLDRLAQRLGRTRGDTLRWLIAQAERPDGARGGAGRQNEGANGHEG